MAAPQSLEISPIIRRAGELCLDCIRDAVPGCECSIAYLPSKTVGVMRATITVEIDGVRRSCASEFVIDRGTFTDEGEFLAQLIWVDASRALGLELPRELLHGGGGVPKSLRPRAVSRAESFRQAFKATPFWKVNAGRASP